MRHSTSVTLSTLSKSNNGSVTARLMSLRMPLVINGDSCRRLLQPSLPYRNLSKLFSCTRLLLSCTVPTQGRLLRLRVGQMPSPCISNTVPLHSRRQGISCSGSSRCFAMKKPPHRYHGRGVERAWSSGNGSMWEIKNSIQEDIFVSWYNSSEDIKENGYCVDIVSAMHDVHYGTATKFSGNEKNR